MANGDIIACSVNSDGFTIDITFEGMSSGGTHDLGFGADNDPTQAKITLSLTSEGFDSSGTLTTVSRSLYGVPCLEPNLGAMRKAYPDDADPEETVSGSDLIVRYALSDFIYDDDTSITINCDSALYNDGSIDNNSISDFAVTNNSTLDYPKVIGKWAIADRQTIVGTDLHLEFVAFHRFAQNRSPVAAVKFTITDEHSNSVSNTITDLTISDDSPLTSIQLYQSDIDVSSLTDLDNITIQAQIYPHVGDNDSILNTNDGSYSFPTPLYTNLQFRLDKTGAHGHTCVTSGGNDGTGQVYSSQSAAESGNAFATLAAALTALQTYNNSNVSHNDAGGGTIYIDDATYTLNSTNGGTLTEWVTITKMSTASKGTAIFQAAANNASIPTFLKLNGITFSGGTFFNGNNNSYLWVDDCAVNTTGLLTIYRCAYCVATNNTGLFARAFDVFSTNTTQWALIRGNNLTGRHDSFGYCVLGNYNVYIREQDSLTNVLNDGGIFAYNINYSPDTSIQIVLADTYNFTHGFAVVQNILERAGSQAQAMVLISADTTTTTTNHIILWNNTIAGARSNVGYNDIAAGGPYNQVNWSERCNIFSNWNNKDDTFNDNADAYGSWPVGYHVGAKYNLFRTSATDEWFGEFYGVNSKKGTTATPLSPDYVDDESADGGNTGSGDYKLNETSPAYDIALDNVLRYDIEGTLRSDSGSIGSYEMIPFVPPSGTDLKSIVFSSKNSNFIGNDVYKFEDISNLISVGNNHYNSLVVKNKVLIDYKNKIGNDILNN